MSTKVM
ncbi:putative NMDA-type glutamate receptor 1, partial [Danaus plexippus plexippus]